MMELYHTIMKMPVFSDMWKGELLGPTQLVVASHHNCGGGDSSQSIAVAVADKSTNDAGDK